MSGGAAPPEASPRVWLVWSDRGTRALVLAQFREEGFETMSFESARNALAALARGERGPSVLVLDGEDAARDPEGWASLRRASRGARVVAVVPRTRAERPPGADVLLDRPVEIARLVQAVRDVSGAEPVIE